MNSKTRYYDIDWLRVLGMIGIFLFHNARFFNDEDWHVKNMTDDFGMTVFVAILNQFIMPLFFILSAYAVYYSLQRRTGGEFMRERVTRLLVPLVFGIFTHIIVQVYIERVSHGQFTGSFWQFLPQYFNGWYGFGGNFAWMGLHLWYLLMLFLFSWLTLPLFIKWRGENVFLTRLAKTLAKPGMVFLFFIPVALVEMLVNQLPDSLGRRDFGGWSPLTYLMIFILGYILVSNDRYRDAIERQRFFSLILALVALFGGFYLILGMDVSSYDPAFSWIRGFNTWAWLLTFLGFASHHLNFNNRFLSYANEAVLPFYILHQSVIVIVGYFIADWDIAVFPKFIFMLVVNFTVIMVLYEFIVKRIGVLRFLFGMKG
jgi:peptidoglycan/LPS O-acetylase OafA/YrhL